MRRITAVLLSVVTLLFTAATLLAHEETHEGTVVAVKLNRFAAVDGVEARIEIQVTGGKRPMVFDIMQWKTKVFRDGTAVSLSAARILDGEAVSVLFNHDEPGEGALEIRLAARE